eukprot:3637290-Pyramimonas_sp.AAC.1
MGGGPAWDFLAIRSWARPLPDASSICRPLEPKSDDSYRFPMTRSDYKRELLAPWGGGSRLRLPLSSLAKEAPA